jgi:uracil-DNA glycosylase
MGIGEHLETWEGWQASLAALAWQVDLGVTEPVTDTAVNRYELVVEVAKPVAPVVVAPVVQGGDAVAAARAAAGAAGTLEELRSALAGYEHCELKRGARNLVFADGNPAARVLILGEAPGRDEDREGKPFVGRAGQLLDRMFAAIGLSRDAAADRAIYITNVLPWRPPENRDPTAEEMAMMRPFVERHIALVAPQVIVVMGNTPLACLFHEKGILRARGVWREAFGIPVLPMTHPAYLLRQPEAKREAWADLQALRERLGG